MLERGFRALPRQLVGQPAGPGIATGADLLLTLEYDDSKAGGPPFSVHTDEVLEYWGQLRRVAEHNDIDDCPPKFRAAGLTEVIEAVWVSD